MAGCVAANHHFYSDDETGRGGRDRRGRTEITLRLLPVHRPRETRVGSRTRGYSNNANRIHRNPNEEKQVLAKPRHRAEQAAAGWRERGKAQAKAACTLMGLEAGGRDPSCGHTFGRRNRCEGR